MQNVQNIETQRASFVDELGHVLAGLGLQTTAARVLAYLTVTSDPATLDDIAAHIGASKSGVSVAARTLEMAGLAARVRERGTKRVRYEAINDTGAMTAARMKGAEVMLAKLRQAIGVADGPVAKARLEDQVAFYEFMIAEMDGMLARWNERRAQ